MAWGEKDPDAIRDYGVDWTKDIGEATIANSSWKLDGAAWPDDAALRKVDAGNTTTGTVIRFGGGVAGATYAVTNHVVLSNGEEDERTFKLKVREQ